MFTLMPISECVTIIKDVAVAIAAAVTATVAVKGLSSWNRELKGKANFDVARALAKATYKLRDDIKNCRSPFLSVREFPNDYGSHQGGDTDRPEAAAVAHVYSNSW